MTVKMAVWQEQKTNENMKEMQTFHLEQKGYH